RACSVLKSLQCPEERERTAMSADRLEIQDLMARYGFAVDGQDWDAYRRVFTPTATIDYSDSGGMRAELEEIVAWISVVLAPYAGLQHNMTNHVAEIDGDR